MVQVHNGILLSHKKEHIWLSSNKTDEPKQSEVKSERENKYYILMKTHGV